MRFIEGGEGKCSHTGPANGLYKEKYSDTNVENNGNISSTSKFTKKKHVFQKKTTGNIITRDSLSLPLSLSLSKISME